MKGTLEEDIRIIWGPWRKPDWLGVGTCFHLLQDLATQSLFTCDLLPEALLRGTSFVFLVLGELDPRNLVSPLFFPHICPQGQEGSCRAGWACLGRARALPLPLATPPADLHS